MGEGFFFQSGPARLYGFLEAAAGSPGPGAPGDEGALLVHPFMEERQDSHPIYRDMARRLAARGYPALRFDLHGHGDSEGEWPEATVPRWLDDIAAAAEVLKKETGVRRVALFGLRFGGTLAALAARTLRPAHLGLWQPVVRGQQYAVDLLRAHLSAEMVLHKRAGISREVLIEKLGRGENVNLFGYLLSPAQYQAVSAIDLVHDLRGYDGPTLLVDVVRTETARESPDLKALATVLGPRATLTKAVETQSLFAEGKLHYTQAERVAEATLAWLEAT